MNPLDNLSRDVSLALALLLDNQDKWDPEIIAARSCTEPFQDGSIICGRAGMILPLTLIPWVRS